MRLYHITGAVAQCQRPNEGCNDQCRAAVCGKQVSEEAADPEMREVAADAYASLLRVKGHDSSADLAGMRADEDEAVSTMATLALPVSNKPGAQPLQSLLEAGGGRY